MNFLNFYGMDYDTVNFIDDEKKLHSCDFIIVPGGWAPDYETSIRREAIIDYVKKGGKYLGICAGAYFMSRYVIWGDPFCFCLMMFIDEEGIGTAEKYGDIYHNVGLYDILGRSSKASSSGVYFSNGKKL